MHAKCVSRLASIAVITVSGVDAFAQNPVRPNADFFEANALGVPIDPITRIDPGQRPRDAGRRTLDPLGLTAEQLATARAVTYSAEHLEDASGALQVFYASVVKDDDRWVFWSEDLSKTDTRSGSEVQLTLDATNGARYLVDFVIDSAPQQFAVVSGDARTTVEPELGHLALIVSGTGREHKIRLLPLGDASYKARRFTLFAVTVTPIL
jgi:hypothetical protein